MSWRSVCRNPITRARSWSLLHFPFSGKMVRVELSIGEVKTEEKVMVV
jgi:hypothetical protein